MDRHQVLVIGGGFGGLNATRALAKADVDVTVVDRTNHARVLLADVQSLDLDRRVVRARPPDGSRAGAAVRHARRGGRGHPLVLRPRPVRRVRPRHEDRRGRAPPARRDPVQVRAGRGGHRPGRAGRVADVRGRRADRGRAGRPGRRAGPPGAPPRLPGGEHHGRPDHPARGRGRRTPAVRPEAAAVHPGDAGEAGCGDPPQHARGRHGPRLDHGQGSGRGGDDPGPDPDLGGRRGRVPTRPAARRGDRPATDQAGRVAVNPDCTLPGHPEVFAIGDMVALNGLPGVAQPAMQEGTYVGLLIRDRLAGRGGDPKPFSYLDKGNMATIGHRSAVADAFGRKVTGVLAYLMWGFVHVLYLIGWGNRLGTMYTWARARSAEDQRRPVVVPRPGPAPVADDLDRADRP